MLIGWWWTSDKLLGKWLYGWAYTRYFDDTVGQLCGHMVGHSDCVVVWLVTDCRSCVGPVKKWPYGWSCACYFVHTIGCMTKLVGRS